MLFDVIKRSKRKLNNSMKCLIIEAVLMLLSNKQTHDISLNYKIAEYHRNFAYIFYEKMKNKTLSSHTVCE